MTQRTWLITGVNSGFGRQGANEIAVMRQLQQLLQLATLFDCVEDVLVWIKDREGRYCWVNRAFLINYAMDRLRSERPADTEGVLGKTDYDLSPTFLADQFRLDDEQVLTGARGRFTWVLAL